MCSNVSQTVHKTIVIFESSKFITWHPFCEKFFITPQQYVHMYVIRPRDTIKCAVIQWTVASSQGRNVY